MSRAQAGGKFFSSIGKALGRALLEPSAGLKDPVDRRQARLLSIFILSEFLLLVLIAGLYAIAVPGYRLPTPHRFGFLIWPVLYWMSRRGHTRTVVILLLPLYPAMAILNLLQGSALDVAGTLALLIPSYIFASVFLSPIGTAIYGIATTVLMALLPVLAPARVPAYSNILGPLSAGVLSLALIIIAMRHRDAIERDRQTELRRAYDSTLEGWARALEFRDRETEGHSRRVADLSLRLAEACGLSGEALEAVYRGALLHDIGKMALPDSILGKKGELDQDELAIMRTHPRVAVDLLAPSTFLRTAMDIPAFHHERWDGTGYPYGLEGEDIPLAARIFIVVDTWDALLSDRPYRKAWTREQAIQYLQHHSGSQFDPRVVRRFLEIIV